VAVFDHLGVCVCLCWVQLLSVFLCIKVTLILFFCRFPSSFSVQRARRACGYSPAGSAVTELGSSRCRWSLFGADSNVGLIYFVVEQECDRVIV